MEFDLKVGLEYKSETVVKDTDTAKAFGSGDISVYASPMMIGLMENAALFCVEEYLPQGFTTVGINVNVNHLKSTPVGMKVYALAKLESIKGKKLHFTVEAHDEEGLIGEGSHIRYIVNSEEFLKKINSR